MADRLPHVDVAGWLLGDLEPDEYDRTSRHLATCEECRAEANELRATAEWVLTTGPDPQPSPDLADRIVAAIDAEAHPVPVTPPEGLTAADLTRTDLELPAPPSAPPTARRTEPIDPVRPEQVETPPVQHDPTPDDSSSDDPTPDESTSVDPRARAPRRTDDHVADDHLLAEPARDPAADPVTPAAPVPPIESPTSFPAPDATGGQDDTVDDPADTGPTAGTSPTGSGRPPGRSDRSRPEDARAARRDLPRWLRPAAAAVAVAAIVLVAVVLGTGGGLPGEIELQAQLATVGDDTTADVTVRRLDSGRAVDVTSENLPILPDGGIYELWFVGPGDTPEQPNRISAGTFHPDADGTTDVLLHAAVVPADYPTVVITAEPNNGDPAVNGPEVLRADG